MTSAAIIMRALGGHRAGRTFMAKCPCHADGTASLAIRDADGRVLLFCHAGCDQRDVIDALHARGLWDRASVDRRLIVPPAARAAPDVERSIYVQSIWNAAGDPRGTLAEKYLTGRGLELDDALCGHVLRFHPALKLDDARPAVSALIAAFRPIQNDPGEDVEPQAVHRIFLTPDGKALRDAEGKAIKRMLGSVRGSAVKLDADENVTHGLGVCEGIETGLAIRATGWRPVWAFGSAGAIKVLEPIPGIETLTVFADHDATGLGVAQVCAERWQTARREVFIRWPSGLGRDYADPAP